jgi:hypothetical protein
MERADALLNPARMASLIRVPLREEELAARSSRPNVFGVLLGAGAFSAIPLRDSCASAGGARPERWCNWAEQAASERAYHSAVVSERLAVGHR